MTVHRSRNSKASSALKVDSSAPSVIFAYLKDASLLYFASSFSILA